MLTLVRERHDKLVTNLIAHCARDANCARLTQGFQPCGDVDAIAEDVIAVNYNIAKVDATAQNDVLFGRKFSVALRQTVLDPCRTGDCLDRACKCGEQAIPHQFDYPAMVSRNGRVDDLSVNRLYSIQGPEFVDA